MERRLKETEKRFWDKVCKTDGCWLWKGYKNRAGYGQFYNRKPMSAHRFSWTIHNGPIPDGLWICHHCDNPGCVNPTHLFLGNHLDNMNDMIKKGRIAKWEKQGLAKLTRFQVAIARDRYTGGESIASLAREMGVCHATMLEAVKGYTWKNIDTKIAR